MKPIRIIYRSCLVALAASFVPFAAVRADQSGEATGVLRVYTPEYEYFDHHAETYFLENYDYEIALEDGTPLRSWWHRKAVRLPAGVYRITVDDCGERVTEVVVRAGEETRIHIDDC